jgi:hypothetical protein
MSRRLGEVGHEVAAAVIAAVIELPATIELLSLRTLGWPMAELVRSAARLNLLSLEALAAARQLGAEVCLAAIDDNPALQSAARDLEIPVRILSG